MEVPGGERGNVQTGGGDKVSTISLLGCSTSMALAMGPTDEEEEFDGVLEHLLVGIEFKAMVEFAIWHIVHSMDSYMPNLS